MAATMPQSALDALVDDHFAAEIDGDLPRLLATFAVDVEHDVVGDPSVSRGRDQVAAFYRDLLAGPRLEQIDTVHRYHGDDFVVDESLVTAKAVGTPFGIPGRDRTLQFRLLHVFDIRDGQITRENAWIDTASVLAAIGSQ